MRVLAPWLACWAAGPALAANITVDGPGDGIDGGCSLRAAILSANLDAAPARSTCASGSGHDQIFFSFSGFIALDKALPDILDDVAILGPGPAALVIDGNAAGSVLTVAGTGVTISGLALTNGDAPFGGGLRVRKGASVTVSGLDVYSNRASEEGGGVASNGTLVLGDSAIHDNSAAGGGGGIYASAGSTLDLERCDISDNTTGGAGGGLFVAAAPTSVTLAGLGIRGNKARAGGGIHAIAAVAIADAAIEDNAALGGADVAVAGGGIQGTGDVSVTDTVIRNNVAGGAGTAGAGGIHAEGDVVATRARIEGNKAGGDARDVAGGIAGAGVRLIDSTIAENATTTSAADGVTGSAILATGEVSIAGSTIADNLAADPPGRSVGAVMIAGPALASVLVNSTVSENRARGAAVNLGVAGSALSVVNSTIASNRGNGSGSAGIQGAGTVTLANTIVFGNDVDCRAVGGGTIVSAGYNIDGDDSCGLRAGGDQARTDPGLGPLAGNGGATPTHALEAGSPAIDAGDDLQCPETDQRGVARSADGNGDGAAQCDVGAFEQDAGDDGAGNGGDDGAGDDDDDDDDDGTDGDGNGDGGTDGNADQNSGENDGENSGENSGDVADNANANANNNGGGTTPGDAPAFIPGTGTGAFPPSLLLALLAFLPLRRRGRISSRLPP